MPGKASRSSISQASCGFDHRGATDLRDPRVRHQFSHLPPEDRSFQPSPASHCAPPAALSARSEYGSTAVMVPYKNFLADLHWFAGSLGSDDDWVGGP
jgi:hypothetical protein